MAKVSALSPQSLFSDVSAPDSSSSFAASSCPSRAAIISGVEPFGARALTFAPRWISSPASSVCPLKTA